MAATRPSIMSLGATISAPARACETAALASHSSVGSFCDFAIHHQAAVAVAGVLAIANVGHHQELRDFALERAHGLLHDAIVGVGARCDFVFGFRNPKQNDAADAERMRLRAFL